MNKAEQIKQDGYKERYLKEQEAKIRKWLGDAVRVDELGCYVWTQPDHRMLLSRGEDLSAINPNIEEYYSFAVDAINGKIKGKYGEYENTIMQEFTYDAGYQNIKSGSMNIFCLRGWGEISSSDIRSPAVFHDDLGYWIADALECKRKAITGGGVEMNWISVKDRLPEDMGEPYQVIGALIKEDGGNYKGTYIRKFVQDWNVRMWPNNFISWCPDPVGHVYVPDKPAEEG